MRYLILTGTTGVPMLEESVLSLAKSNEHISFLLQTKNIYSAQSKNIDIVDFLTLDSLDTSQFSAVIGHCGAGTTFWALTQKIPFCAFVDLDRDDAHQSDLGDWLRRRNYAYVIKNRALTTDDLNVLSESTFDKYHPEPFQIQRLKQYL